MYITASSGTPQCITYLTSGQSIPIPKALVAMRRRAEEEVNWFKFFLYGWVCAVWVQVKYSILSIVRWSLGFSTRFSKCMKEIAVYSNSIRVRMAKKYYTAHITFSKESWCNWLKCCLNACLWFFWYKIYYMLFFTGGIYTIAGLSIHKFLIRNFLVDRVAVAVSIIKWTLSGTMLLFFKTREFLPETVTPNVKEH